MCVQGRSNYPRWCRGNQWDWVGKTSMKEKDGQVRESVGRGNI